MFILRRNVNAITLNPYEYATTEDNELLRFNTEEEAVKHIDENLEGITINSTEEAWEKAGIEVHEITQQEYDNFLTDEEE